MRAGRAIGFCGGPLNSKPRDVCRPDQEGAGLQEAAVVLLIHHQQEQPDKKWIMYVQARICQHKLHAQKVNGPGKWARLSVHSQEQRGQIVEDDLG